MTITLAEVLEKSGGTIISPWSPTGLRELAAGTPELSRNDWLLAGDANLLQLRWFIESTVPAGVDLSGVAGMGRLLLASHERVTALFPHLGTAERKQLALEISRLAMALIQRENSSRQPVSKETRRHLLDRAGRNPFCYLCGYRFAALDIEQFLGGSQHRDVADVLVDFLYPRGLKQQDRRIAIEHVRPVSDGGSSELGNVRLSCFFCNSLKADALTLYARGQYRQQIRHPTLGLVYPPNPLWVVRILALEGKCLTCGMTSEGGQLLISPTILNGIPRYINPLSLLVFCRVHDPIQEHRYVPASTLLRSDAVV